LSRQAKGLKAKYPEQFMTVSGAVFYIDAEIPSKNRKLRFAWLN